MWLVCDFYLNEVYFEMNKLMNICGVVKWKEMMKVFDCRIYKFKCNSLILWLKIRDLRLIINEVDELIIEKIILISSYFLKVFYVEEGFYCIVLE